MLNRIRDAAPLAGVIALLLMLNLMYGCAGRQLTPDSEVQLYKALKSSATAYSAAREVLREWDKTHPFTDEEKAQIEAYAEDYRLAYHLALEAWEMWRRGEASEMAWVQAANEALDLLAKFERLVLK